MCNFNSSAAHLGSHAACTSCAVTTPRHVRPGPHRPKRAGGGMDSSEMIVVYKSAQVRPPVHEQSHMLEPDARVLPSAAQAAANSSQSHAIQI